MLAIQIAEDCQDKCLHSYSHLHLPYRIQNVWILTLWMFVILKFLNQVEQLFFCVQINFNVRMITIMYWKLRMRESWLIQKLRIGEWFWQFICVLCMVVLITDLLIQNAEMWSGDGICDLIYTYLQITHYPSSSFEIEYCSSDRVRQGHFIYTTDCINCFPCIWINWSVLTMLSLCLL